MNRDAMVSAQPQTASSSTSIAASRGDRFVLTPPAAVPSNIEAEERSGLSGLATFSSPDGILSISGAVSAPGVFEASPTAFDG